MGIPASLGGLDFSLADPGGGGGRESRGGQQSTPFQHVYRPRGGEEQAKLEGPDRAAVAVAWESPGPIVNTQEPSLATLRGRQ